MQVVFDIFIKGYGVSFRDLFWRVPSCVGKAGRVIWE